MIYTPEPLETLVIRSISTERSPRCASKTVSLSLVGAVPNLAVEMIVDRVSSELSSIRLLMRTSIELA